MKIKKIIKTVCCIGIASSILFSVGSIKTYAAIPYSRLQEDDVDGQGFFMSEFGKQWIDSLTNEEKVVVTLYTGNDFEDVNYYLRSGKKEILSNISKSVLNKKIKLIDSALEKSKLKEDIIVYRGTDVEEFNETKGFLKHTLGFDLDSIKGIENYDEYIQKAISIVQKNINKTNKSSAYTSTSLDEHSRFTNSPIVMEIKIPKGAHAGYVKDLSLFKEEEEVLLPRKTKFKVTGASTIQEKGKNKLVIKVTVVK